MAFYERGAMGMGNGGWVAPAQIHRMNRLAGLGQAAGQHANTELPGKTAEAKTQAKTIESLLNRINQSIAFAAPELQGSATQQAVLQVAQAQQANLQSALDSLQSAIQGGSQVYGNYEGSTNAWNALDAATVAARGAIASAQTVPDQVTAAQKKVQQENTEARAREAAVFAAQQNQAKLEAQQHEAAYKAQQDDAAARIAQQQAADRQAQIQAQLSSQDAARAFSLQQAQLAREQQSNERALALQAEQARAQADQMRYQAAVAAEQSKADAEFRKFQLQQEAAERAAERSLDQQKQARQDSLIQSLLPMLLSGGGSGGNLGLILQMIFGGAPVPAPVAAGPSGDMVVRSDPRRVQGTGFAETF